MPLCLEIHLDQSSPLRSFWTAKSFISQLASEGIVPSLFFFSSHFTLLRCIPLKPTQSYSTSPRREVLVLLSRMMSSGNSSRYSGANSSTTGTMPTSSVSITNGGSYSFKFSTFTTEYICIYISKSRRKALFPIFSKMVNGPY